MGLATERGYTQTPSVISNGTSLGSTVNVGGYAIAGILMPAAWTAAAITFQVSIDGTNFFDLTTDDGAPTECTIPSVAAVAGKAIAMNTILDKLAAWIYVRPRSGTSAAAVNQGANRTLTFVLKA